MTTGGFDQAVSALATSLSFGSAAAQMLEQHGHEVDRTLVERRTYAVGREAVKYLEGRRAARKSTVTETEGQRPGAKQLLLQVDGGGVPVGRLERPARDEADEAQELTPVRKLPKGRRPKSKREVRVVLVRKQGCVDDEVVDVHVAPHGQPEYSGDRMYCAALEAGLGDATHIHGTFDMARWQHLQFEEQFSAQPEHSICADFFHTIEYIAAAAKGCEPDTGKLPQWIDEQKRRLREGKRTDILEALGRHDCSQGNCPQTDRSECAVVAARRYLIRNGQYMDYPRFRAQGLPIGSGEVEGRIRHIVRRRLDIPGDWREDNLKLITALITIRESGWWDDFWEWRDQRDRQRFRDRLRGVGLNRFRGTKPPHRTSPASNASTATATASTMA